MTQAVELEDARQMLAETDGLESLESKIKDIEIDVTDTSDGARASMEINGENLPMSLLAVRELAGRLSIPTNYLPKCPARLQADQLTYWLSTMSDKRRIRAVVGSNAVQGITSPKFIPLLNIPLLELLGPAVGRVGTDKVKVHAIYHGWEATRIVLASDDNAVDVENPHFKLEDDKTADRVLLGVDFINSLTDLWHTELRPAIVRVSTGTMLVTPLTPGRAKIRFDRRSGIETKDWVPAAVSEIQGQYEDIRTQLNGIATHEVEQIEVALESQLENLPGTLREAVFPAYEQEQTPTLWGIVQAIARAAKDADESVPEGHRYQAQKFAGELALNAICEECKRPVIEH